MYVLALSNLVVASYSEDKYGVVQKSLADIITAIVSLRDVSRCDVVLLLLHCPIQGFLSVNFKRECEVRGWNRYHCPIHGFLSGKFQTRV